MSYDGLTHMEKPEKYRKISMITSNANWMNGHEFRLNLIKELRLKGVKFDLFGKGFNQIENKAEAHLSYKYSIVIENSFYPYCWTGKIIDCLLTYTVPIYVGAKNITDFFPGNSLVSVAPDINKIIKRIEKIEEYPISSLSIEKARMLILEEYQFFPFVSKLINFLAKNGEIGEKKEYLFIKNTEGKNISIYRKLEYRLRRLLNLKPY